MESSIFTTLCKLQKLRANEQDYRNNLTIQHEQKLGAKFSVRATKIRFYDQQL